MRRWTLAFLLLPLAAPRSAVAQEPASPSTASVLLDVVTGASASAEHVPLDAADVGAFFDSAFELQRLEHRLVGAVVSVVQRGEVVFQKGYGWADLEAREPADPGRSLFRIASITKTFVWTAVMQLAEEGRIDLDADVERYLDFDIPDTYAEPIRVRHLLTHTAGFEETWTGWGARTAEDVGELGDALRDLLPARVRPPGRHAAYSNYGAALAGYIVERVSGMPWQVYTERRILEPLDMTSTTARVDMGPELRERHARGYVWRAGRFVSTDYRYLRLPPAGIMSSTATDMAVFMLAHLNGGAVGDRRILAEETVDRMQSPLFDPHEGLSPILHGFYRSDRNGQIVLGHGGDTNQFHSDMRLLPDADLGVFVSYNSDPGAAARSNVINAFIDHFFPAEHLREAPEPANVDLSEYSGSYVPLRSAFTTFERIRAARRAGSVQAEGSELRFGGDGRLVPTGPDRFTGLYGDVTVVFERDDRGEVTHMLIGSPLSTFARARGLEGDRAVPAMLFLLFVSAAAVLVWSYRLFRPIPVEQRLPSPHVRVAWLHGILNLGLLVGFTELLGDTIYGPTSTLRFLLVVSNLNAVLASVVVAFAIRQWIGRRGTLLNRSGYALVALAALTALCLGWAYNVVGTLA